MTPLPAVITTSGAASGDKRDILTTLGFQWIYETKYMKYLIFKKSNHYKYQSLIVFCNYFRPYGKTLRPSKNGRNFPDDIFKCIFLNENIWISSKISLKFVPEGPINNISAMVQMMAWRLPGDKPLTEPMMVNLLTQICVTRPQWVSLTPTKSLHTEDTFFPKWPSCAHEPHIISSTKRIFLLLVSRNLCKTWSVY